MQPRNRVLISGLAALLATLGISADAPAQQSGMSFFVTSAGPGSTQGTAIVGHIDRQGLRDDDQSRSWNSSHPSRGPDGGCSQADLRSTGGDGLFYCFAAN